MAPVHHFVRTLDTRKITVFAFTDFSIVFDTAKNFSMCMVDGKDSQNQASVGNQNGLSRSDGRNQIRVREGQLFGISKEGVICGQNDSLSFDQLDFRGIIGKETGSDFCWEWFSITRAGSGCECVHVYL